MALPLPRNMLSTLEYSFARAHIGGLRARSGNNLQNTDGKCKPLLPKSHKGLPWDLIFEFGGLGLLIVVMFDSGVNGNAGDGIAPLCMQN